MKIFFFLLSFLCSFSHQLYTEEIQEHFEELFVTYLLPEKHPLRNWLDSTFLSPLVLDSEEALQSAGFEILACIPHHPAVAKHPSAPGYIFKMYLNGERELPREEISSVEWLLRRCIGASSLREWMQKEGIYHFIVPEKWLYPLSHGETHPLVLIASDMELESEEATLNAWKTVASEEHLDELYSILKAGYGSIYLTGNIPYTKSGKFAFVDTEKFDQTHKLAKVKPYFSESMQQYWDELTQ